MLFRRIAEGAAWKKAADKSLIGRGIAPLLPLVVAEFTPRVKDAGGLSVYECPADRESLAKLASAIGASLNSYDKGSSIYVGVERVVIEALGLTVKDSPGETGHSDFDQAHAEVIVETDDAILQVARAFVDGETFEIMGAVIARALRSEFADGKFDFLPAAKRGPDSAMSKLGITLIREGVGALRPV